MVVKGGKIYLALKEIAPSSPYSADYLRIRILHGKLQGTKFGREWYTTSEWLAEYLSRYGQKIARAAAAEGKFPVRYAAEKQFIPLMAGEDARAPAVEAAAAPVRKPDLPDIGPPLQKTIYDFPIAPERAAASPPPVPSASSTGSLQASSQASQSYGGQAGQAPSLPPAVSQVEPPPKLAIIRHPAYRELAAKLRSSLPLKFVAVPLTVAVLTLFLSVAAAGGISPARVLGFARGAAERAVSFALEIPVSSPREVAAAVQGALRRAPHRLALVSARIAALPERFATAVGDFLLTAAIPSPAELAAWPDGVVARLETLPPLAGPQRLAAGLVDAVRDFIAGLPRPKLPERIVRFFNLSSPPLTAPQANAPVRYALEPRDEKQEAGIKKQEEGTPVPPVVTRVREVVQTREVVRPADVSLFQAKLDQLNAGLRTTVNKLVADVAGLYEGAEIKTSVVRAFSPSQSINELFDLKIDSGLTVRSGNLTVSAGDLTVTGNGRFTGTLNSDGAFSAGSLGTGGLLTVSGNGTSSLAYGLTAATSGGAVGFGTTSPSQFFAVGGNTYLAGGLGLGTVTTSPGGFQTTGMAVIGSILDVRGAGTSTFAGPLVVAGALSVNAGVLTISSTSTVTTQVAITRAAVTPHTFASWTTGAANSAVTDSTLLINPASAVSDSNLFGIAIAGSPRFLVDAEGDIYGRNLILEGGTTQATTTLSGNLLVEGNATLGDAANADTHIIRGATILYASTTQAALTIWNSSNGDLLSLLSGTGQTPSTRFTFTNGGNLGIGSTTPTVGLSVATSTYITGGLGVGEATTSSGGLLVKGQGVFAQTLDVRGTGTSTFSGGVSSVGLASSNGFRVSAGDTVLAGGLAVTGSSNLTGSVGIGTSTPSHLLTVRGPFLANGTSTIEGAGLIAQALFSTTSLNFYTASNAAPRITVDSSGNVGIGTTSPGALLSMSGPFLAQGTSTILGGGLNLQALQATGTLSFYTSGTAAPRMVIDSSGNVGIGTTSPGNKLDVAGTIDVSTNNIAALRQKRVGGAYETLMLLDGSDNLFIGQNNIFPAIVFVTSLGQAFEMNNSASLPEFKILSTTNNFISAPGDLTLRTTANNGDIVLTTNGTGNVGIGTTSPGALLSIIGSGIINNTLTVGGVLKATSTALFATEGGSVGIGTSTPSHLLTVRGPFLANGTSTIEGAGLIAQSLFSTTSLNFYTASNAVPRMTIDSSGNVGIGTTSPGALFAVNGPGLFVGTSTIFGGLNLESISATGTLGFYTRGTAAPRMVVDSSGNVGIGTTSPGRLLGLRGSFLANATSTIEGGGLIGQGLFSTTSLAFYTNSNAAARLFIEGGGNIGVGTTGPFALLAVNAPVGSASFAIGSTTATSFMVDEFGNVGIGGRPWPDTVTVAGRVLKSKLFLTTASTSENFITAVVTASGQTVNPVFIVTSGGAIFMDSSITNPADYAELLETVDTDLSPGELVSIDLEHPNHVRRATTTADSRLMGIISTKPGIVGVRASDVTDAAAERLGSPNWKQVAFLGQIPTNVTGNVAIGDYITSSDIPGVGRKAEPGEPTVCIAFEPHTGDEVGSVNCLLARNNRGYARLDPGIGAMASGDGLWTVDEATGRIKTIYPLDLSGNDILNVKSVLSANGTWSIDESGKLVAAEITAREKLQVGSAESPRGITLFDFDTGQPNCVFVQSGALRSVPGECTFSSSIESQAPNSNTQIINNEQNSNDQTAETQPDFSAENSGGQAVNSPEPVSETSASAEPTGEPESAATTDGLQAAGSTSPDVTGTDAAGSETAVESTAPAAEPQPEPTTDATTSSEPAPSSEPVSSEPASSEAAADSATATSTPAA